MTIEISELAGNASTDSVEQSDNNDSGSDSDALITACEAIDANIDSAKEYVDNHGNKDELTAFAETLADNDELWSVMEEYREKLDVHRIKQNYLYNVDGDFTKWSAAFYGDSDNPDPEADTYNGIQAKSRDMGGNLAYYKALFPEPVEAHWEQEPVLWEERPDEDAHIYVTQEFASEYSDFTLEDGRPRPPTDQELAELQGSSGGSGTSSADAPINPGTMTVETLKNKLKENDYTSTEVKAILTAEQNGDQRKTAIQAIRRALDNANDSDDSSEPDESGESPEEAAGRLVAETGTDMHPKAIAGMLRGGMGESEVKEML